MLQRSPEWYSARRGRPTASQINRILGKETLAATKQAIESYADELANEIVFGIDESDEVLSWDMRRGIELEPIAFEKFRDLKYLDFIDVEKCGFFVMGEGGASPDGLVGKDAVLEIKVPRPNKFFGLVRKGYDAIDQKYIDQMQMQMMCTNSKRAHFFNYIIFNNVEMWHEIIVDRDDERIDLIKSRIDTVVRLRDEFVEYLTKNRQF